MENKIFINTTLNKIEEELISRNCYERIVLVIHYENERNEADFIIKEHKNFPMESVSISIEHGENSASNEYIKIDSQCPWWIKGEHYAILDFNNVPKETDSFEIILKATFQKIIGLKMELLEWIIENDAFRQWYALCGEFAYHFEDSFHIGTFARVSDGWKFYPKMMNHILK